MERGTAQRGCWEGHLFYVEQKAIGNDKALDCQTIREDGPEE